MNKLIKSAMVMAGVGVMLGITGCGQSNGTHGEYEATFRELSKVQGVTAEANGLADALSKFDALTPEKQKAELEQLKKELAETKKELSGK